MDSVAGPVAGCSCVVGELALYLANAVVDSTWAGRDERENGRGESGGGVVSTGSGRVSTASAVVTSSESTEKCRSSSPVLMN